MKYLKLFVDFEELMEALDDGERGRLFSAMLSYAREGAEPRLTGNERFLWPAARQQIDKTREQYEKTVAANTQNARKGGRPKAQKAVDLTARAEEEPAEEVRTEKAPEGEARAEEAQAEVPEPAPAGEARTEDAWAKLLERARKEKGREEVRAEEAPAGEAWAKLLERVQKEKDREEVRAEEARTEDAPAKVLPAEGAEVRQAVPAEEEIPLPGEEDAPPAEQAFLPGETAGFEEIPLPGEEDAPPAEQAFLPGEKTGTGEVLLPGETAGTGEVPLPEEDPGAAEKVPIPEELWAKPDLGIAIALPMPEGKPYPLFDYKVRQWEEKYPQVAVREELEKIQAWLLKNPQRRRDKNEIIPFILRWLEKNRRRAPASARRAKERPEPSFDLEEIRRLMLEDSGG